MDKRITARATSYSSSPGASDSSATGVEKDSFLEDMELFSHDNNFYLSEKDAKRHITRRTLSPTVPPLTVKIESQDEVLKQNNSQKSSCVKTSTPSITTRKSNHLEVKSSNRFSAGDGNSQKQSTAAKEVKVKTQDNKIRSQENKVKPKFVETRLQPERKSLVKDRSRRSGSYKDTDQSTDSLKENEQPLNLPKQTSSPKESSKDHHRRSDAGKRLDAKDIPESVALLSAVKEIVSTYTKEEGMKILRTLNELHILSQASLIKNFMCQTDEIRKDLQLGENLGQLKVLMAENDRLKENCVWLKTKNEDLQRRLEDSERIKEENASLKLRLQELIGRKTS